MLAFTASCIPSHRLVNDGDRYFEQCYGADFSPTVEARRKEECWQAWLAHYTRYQPAHRIDYAMRRVESLQQGDPAPGLPGLTSSSQQAQASADAQVALEGVVPLDPAIPAVTETVPKVDIPNGCLEACNRFESQCVAQCPADSVNCRNGCTRDRAICLGGCH